ncbi:MAG: diguanylate cyclase [Candidatus Eremiobacteraeota bacterium]|nr:diguanylate cyclase [Candidatus Eremiobacteraeota bacterium]
MDGPSQPERVQQRQRRDRDLVKGAALLLSTDRPLPDLYDEFVSLLAQFVDASIVLILAPERAALQCVYAYLDGVGGVPDNPGVPNESTSSRVFRDAAPRLYARAHEWNATNYLRLGERIREPEAAIFVPILFGGRSIGVLSVQSTLPNAYDADDLALLETCALYLGARMHSDLGRRDAERFERLAHVDELTAIPNRRNFEESFERESTRARRIGRRLALLMVDVDLFKEFNDRYGHIAGDACLQQIAATIAQSLRRPTDLAARYGGEEFVVLLPETELSGALGVAELLRSSIAALGIPHGGSTLGMVSVSIGCASGMPRGNTERQQLVEAADAALYRAKHAGRNRVAAEHPINVGPLVERRSAFDGVPVFAGRFVERTEDIRRLTVAIERSALVSLIGSAGIGKTRTAIEAIQRILHRFPDGAWFVDLAGCVDARDTEAAILEGFAPLVRPGSSMRDCVRAFQRSRGLLLLDACDRASRAVAACIDLLLEGAPEMRIVATARTALGVLGEAPLRLDRLGQHTSEQLFSARFEESAREPADAALLDAQISSLHGHPLAIELTANYLSALPADLRSRGGSIGIGDIATVRHAAANAHVDRTLERVFKRCYLALDEDGRRVLRRVSMFSGVWSATAAHALCRGEDPDGDMTAGKLEELVRRGLLRKQAFGERTRYRVVEALRAPAHDSLAQSGEVAMVAIRYREYYEELAASMAERFRSEPSTRWIQLLDDESLNIRSVLHMLLAEGEFERAALLLDGLRAWTWERGAFHLQTLCDRLQEAEERFMACGKRAEAAYSLAMAGLFVRSDPSRASAFARAAYDIYEALGDRIRTCYALNAFLSSTFTATGTTDLEWEGALEDAIAVAEEHGEATLVVDLVHRLGIFYMQQIDPRSLAKAMECFTSCIDKLEANGDRERAARHYGSSAEVAFYSGDVADAIARARRAIAIYEQSDEMWFVAIQYMNLTVYAAFAHDFVVARVALAKTFDYASRFDDALVQSKGFETAIHVAVLSGKHREAAILTGYADAVRGEHRMRQPREQMLLDRTLADVRKSVASDEFDRLYERGVTLSAVEADALARSL